MVDKVIWIKRGWQPVDIGFCPSPQAWDREVRKRSLVGDYPEAANMGGHTQLMINDKTGVAIILVTVTAEAERDAFEVMTTLVHESVHVWQFLCRHIGEANPGIEMEAYGIEHIFEGLVAAYIGSQGKGKDWETIHGFKTV